MARGKTAVILPEPPWLTGCDVIRYALKMPADLKEQIKNEASEKGMDTGSYICGLLTGDIKRKKSKKRI